MRWRNSRHYESGASSGGRRRNWQTTVGSKIDITDHERWLTILTVAINPTVEESHRLGHVQIPGRVEASEPDTMDAG